MGHERILVRYRTPAGGIHQELEVTRHEVIDDLVEERRRQLEENMDVELAAVREDLEGKAIDDLAKTWEGVCDTEGDIIVKHADGASATDDVPAKKAG